MDAETLRWIFGGVAALGTTIIGAIVGAIWAEIKSVREKIEAIGNRHSENTVKLESMKETIELLPCLRPRCSDDKIVVTCR